LRSLKCNVLCRYNAMLDKAAVAIGPGEAVERFNAVVSRQALAELNGCGVTAKAAVAAKRAEAAWEDRENSRRPEPMEVDGSSRRPLDPKPNRISPKSVVQARQTAFGAFAALLVCTQTKSKFYEKLFEGGPQRWNALVDSDEWLRLEVETKLFRQRVRWRRRGATGDDDGGGANGGGGGGGAQVDPTLPFTLSATLAATDASLVPPPTPRATRATYLGGAGGADDGANGARMAGGGGSDAAAAEGPLDELEGHPLAAAVFAALEHVSRGGVVDIEGSGASTAAPSAATATATATTATAAAMATMAAAAGSGAATTTTPKLVAEIASLVTDGEVTRLSRMLVIKGILRLHRQEIAAAEATAAAAAAVEPPPEEPEAPDAPEIEVVAEKFLEEVELEKLERAKVGRCTSLIQLTHSLKAPGFNP
jgi:hypothetical protein